MEDSELLNKESAEIWEREHLHIIKFSKPEAEALVPKLGDVKYTVKGNLTTGESFTGSDFVDVKKSSRGR